MVPSRFRAKPAARSRRSIGVPTGREAWSGARDQGVEPSQAFGDAPGRTISVTVLLP